MAEVAAEVTVEVMVEAWVVPAVEAMEAVRVSKCTHCHAPHAMLACTAAASIPFGHGCCKYALSAATAIVIWVYPLSIVLLANQQLAAMKASLAFAFAVLHTCTARSLKSAYSIEFPGDLTNHCRC